MSATNSDSSCRVKIIGILKRIAQSVILAEPCKHFLADNSCFNPKPLVHVLCVQCFFLHSAGSGEDRWSLKYKLQLISLEKKAQLYHHIFAQFAPFFVLQLVKSKHRRATTGGGGMECSCCSNYMEARACLHVR